MKPNTENPHIFQELIYITLNNLNWIVLRPLGSLTSKNNRFYFSANSPDINKLNASCR